MPQKALFNKVRKSQGKSLAANRHGKVVKQKKGNFVLQPKKESARKVLEEGKELTKAINHKNEEAAAGKAEQSGGRLGVVKAPPSTDKDSKKGAKKSK
ncbi:g10420 [Coccomyxa elongata]